MCEVCDQVDDVPPAWPPCAADHDLWQDDDRHAIPDAVVSIGFEPINTATVKTAPTVQVAARLSEYEIVLPYFDEKTFGIRFPSDEDGCSLHILAVKQRGMIATWNLDHPDTVVEPGDRIAEVNGIKDDIDAMLSECAKGVLVKMRLLRAHANDRPERESTGVESLCSTGTSPDTAVAPLSSTVFWADGRYTTCSPTVKVHYTRNHGFIFNDMVAPNAPLGLWFLDRATRKKDRKRLRTPIDMALPKHWSVRTMLMEDQAKDVTNEDVTDGLEYQQIEDLSRAC